MTVSRVSVVVVSYNTLQLTMSAVRSSLGCPQVREVVVVDNASSDRTVHALMDISDDRLTVLVNDTNVGFGCAANRGASVAHGSVLLFLNSDAELSGAACDALLAELDGHDGRGLVGPALMSSDGTRQRSVGLRPAPVDLALRAMGLHRVGGRLADASGIGSLIRRTRTAREYRTADTALVPADTSMISGACFAVGREAFLELGGFDERFFMYFEDADLCRRAAAVGMPIRYVPAALVPHIGGGSSEGDYHFGPLHARAMRQYLGKWYGPAGSALAILLLWLRAVGMSIRLRPQGRRPWEALWAAVTDADPRR